MLRIEELEKILAESGGDLDPETIVSMYMPRRRLKRLSAMILSKDNGVKILDLVRSAEENMYQEKENYYRTAGLDERSHRDAVLALKEQSKTLAFIEIDDLTGLYTKQAFFSSCPVITEKKSGSSV